MPHSIHGACHCGNISFELVTRQVPARIRARACDCRFCRIHATRNWSDPDGTATLRVADERHLQRYRFGLETADFYICSRCGTYVGAVLVDPGGTWSTLNLRLTGLAVAGDPVTYGSEAAAERIERRRHAWTPTTILIGDATAHRANGAQRPPGD